MELYQNVKERARGNWREIHRRLGIHERYLNTRKHCPCPACGGRDRYRYTDHEGAGCFICNQCGAGNGFDLLMRVYGYSFREALQAVAGVLGLNPEASASVMRPCPPPPSVLPPPAPVDRLPHLQRVWDEAHGLSERENDPIRRYLSGRGLNSGSASFHTEALRYLPELPYWHEGEHLFTAPAMIARIENAKGQLQGLHLTYLEYAYPLDLGEEGYHTPDWLKLKRQHRGEDLPAKKMRARFTGALKGAGVYLFPYQDCLAVTEGIESAAAAHELFGLPVCATLSASGMASFDIPERVNDLLIVGDHDRNGTGQKALQALKLKALRQGLKVRTWLPPQAGEDALDYLNALKNSAGSASERADKEQVA